jgi:hypothetical protein
MHLEECDSFLVGIVESVCVMLQCKVSCSLFFLSLLRYCGLIFFHASGTCLDLVGETRWVFEQTAVLEKAPEGTDSLWSDPRCRRTIVLLQDRAQHIGEAVDGCQTSLTTMYSVMLSRNPLPRDFRQLLKTFRTIQRVHLLIKLNLIAGVNFAIGWMRKWHPRLNYD